MELSGISISKRSKKYLADKWPPWILLLRSTFEHLKDDVDWARITNLGGSDRRLYATRLQWGGGERGERTAVDLGLRCPARSERIRHSAQKALSCSY